VDHSTMFVQESPRIERYEAPTPDSTRSNDRRNSYLSCL